MKHLAICIVLALLGMASSANAGRWTSPDGKVAFDLPANGLFIELKNPPAPATAMWATADGATRLIFIVSPNPRNSVLDRSGLEDGTLSQFPGGSLLSSTETSLNGIPIFTIAATNNQKLFIQQSVITFSFNVYKLLAAGPVRISSDPRLSPVFQSISVLDPSPVVPGRRWSEHEVSIQVAQVGIIALFVAGIVVMIRRSKRKPPGPPPLP